MKAEFPNINIKKIYKKKIAPTIHGIKSNAFFSESLKRKNIWKQAETDKWAHKEGLLASILPGQRLQVFWNKSVFTNRLKVVLQVPEGSGNGLLANKP